MSRFRRSATWWVFLLCATCCGCDHSGPNVVGGAAGTDSSSVASPSAPEVQARAVAALERDGAVFSYFIGRSSEDPWMATLTGPRIGDAQVALVSTITSLRKLDLSESGVTDEGLKSLLKMPSLAVLYLRNTSITSLAPLAQLPSLRGLDVTGTRLREADVAALVGSKCKGVKPFDNTVVSAWLAAPPLASSPWVNSADGALSLRLLVSAKAVRAGDPIVVLAELRNNTSKPMNVLRPFGDRSVRKAFKIAGPAGAIVPGFIVPYGPKAGAIVPDFDIMDGANSGAYTSLLPGETIRDRFDADPRYYPRSDLPGEYVIQYVYRPTESDQREAPISLNLPDLWVGMIGSGKVTLVKEK
jgi:hypothetical protein